MEIGRSNAAKSTQIDSNTQSAQPSQSEKPAATTQAQDTMEIGPSVNDLSKILGEGVENKGLVDADQSAFPQFPGTDQQQQRPQLGTVSAGFKFPEDNNRFGFKDPAEEDPIDTLNQKAGFGFDPERDLNLPTGDEVLGGGKGSDSNTIAQLKQQNDALQKQNDALQKQNDLLQQQNSAQQTQMNFLQSQIDKLAIIVDRLQKESTDAKVQKAIDKQTGNTPAKDPNPDAPDNSAGGGAFDPLVNNFGSPMRINKPYVDPTLEDNAGASDVLIQTGQATDPNPADDQDEGGAKRAILSTTDAVTDPNPDVGTLLDRLNGLNNE